MNTEINLIIAVCSILTISTLYILRDTIGEFLFGGKNCNPKG